MQNVYTAAANDILESLVEEDIAKIWGSLDELGECSDADKWRSRLTCIANEFLMSSRFALMRILHNRALSQVKGKNAAQSSHEDTVFADETSFRIQVGQESVTFSDLSIEHARDMSAAEHAQYIACLLEIAGPSPEKDPDLHERVIARAWHDEDSANAIGINSLPPKVTNDSPRLRKAIARIEKESAKTYRTVFSREEALLLGHILHFTPQEMQWYLMRVLDIDEALRMNRSSDLIDMYGLLTQADCLRVEQLKQQYLEICSGIEKEETPERSANWTCSVSSDFFEKVSVWMRCPDSADQNFMAWLKAHAAGLDIPSCTARRVYRNLAVYAYKCAIGKSFIPEETEIIGAIQNLCDLETESIDVRYYLYQDGLVSADKCDSIAKYLYRENSERSGQQSADNTHAWSVVTIRKDRELSSSYGLINSGRTRIQQLLMGEAEVEKSDLLYLLWFTLDLSWGDMPVDDPGIIYCRIFDLKDAAYALLTAALLPDFYPPHLLEQSMMLSVILGAKLKTDPSVVYASVLQTVKKTRNRSKTDPG